MAFTIKIYEKDKYMYSLIKARIETMYPEAYITDPYLGSNSDTDGDMFGEFTKVIYNPKQFGEDFGLDQKSGELSELKEILDKPVPLIDHDGIIDCRKICNALGLGNYQDQRNYDVTDNKGHGRLEVLIPFVYISDREKYISHRFSNMTDSDLALRLDFTSRLRAPEDGGSEILAGNMTGLLEACSSRRFEPNDILKYCSRDNMGFLTPGVTKGDDDVYDIGSTRCRLLLDKCRQLVSDETRIINVLAVAEGFRSAELPALVSDCDRVIILFSGKDRNEEAAASGLINSINRSLTHGTVTTDYIDLKDTGSINLSEVSKTGSGIAGAAV